MSDRIEDQIAHMINLIDRELPPITVEELNTMHEPSVAIAPTRRSPGSIVAVTVATIVLIVVAGVALLINNPGETPADTVLTTAAEPTPTTLQEQAPTTLQEQAPTTVAPDATVAPPTTPDPEIVSPAVGVVAETLAMLEVALEQDEVQSQYGFDIKAALEYVYSYLAGTAESQNWPEPAFDTSPLGAEILLTALDPSVLLSQLDWVSEEDFLAPSNNSGGLQMAPFFVGAQLEGTTVSAAFTIVLAFKDDIVDVEWSLLSESGNSSFFPFPEWPSSPYRLPRPPNDLEELDVPNIIMVQGVIEGTGGPVVFGGLPPDASVITTTFRDGTQVWQRPVSGIAIFDDPDRNCEGATFAGCEGEYTALNANGDEILRIVLGAGDDFDSLGFRVDSP